MAGVLPGACICGLCIVLLFYFGLIYLVYLELMYLNLWDFCNVTKCCGVMCALVLLYYHCAWS